jgi:hypothetical protein
MIESLESEFWRTRRRAETVPATHDPKQTIRFQHYHHCRHLREIVCWIQTISEVASSLSPTAAWDDRMLFYAVGAIVTSWLFLPLLGYLIIFWSRTWNYWYYNRWTIAYSVCQCSFHKTAASHPPRWASGGWWVRAVACWVLSGFIPRLDLSPPLRWS